MGSAELSWDFLEQIRKDFGQQRPDEPTRVESEVYLGLWAVLQLFL